MPVVSQGCAEELATGCAGASSYKQYARARGYKYIEVENWTSSAGDWTFMVSKDGAVWVRLFQTNNYPRAGFSHTIDETREYHGAITDVWKQLEEEGA